MQRHQISLPYHRNIGIAAHIDAGKTTLTERMLYLAGAVHHCGDVHNGDTAMDSHPLERKKGITILAAATECEWTPVLTPSAMPHRIRIIDTPGHVDFTAEVERSLRVLDGMVAVFCAVGGVQPQTETVWRQANRYGVPRIAFVNKMDRAGADFGRVVREMRTRLGANAWPVMLPFGAEDQFQGQLDLIHRQAIVYDDASSASNWRVMDVPASHHEVVSAARAEMVAALAEVDDAMAELFLSGVDPSPAQLHATLRRVVLSGKLLPVIPGAAYRHKGIQALLDAVAHWLPSPLDRNPDVSSTMPLSALAFKTTHDDHSGRLVWLRLYSGRLQKGDSVLVNAARQVRAGRLLRLHAGRTEEIDSASAGDIVAAVGLRDVRTGQTLSALQAPVVLEPPQFPEPVVSMAVEPESRGDQERMTRALHILADDDPTFRVSTDAETGQLLVSGMGELHLAIQLERLKDDHKVRVRAGRPRIAFRETVTRAARGEGRQIKRSGGPGQHGHVILEISPGEPASGLVIEDAISGGAIPAAFVPACRKGVLEALQHGVVGGYPVTDVKVKLLDGSHHPVDSNELAFRIAAALAVKDALSQAGSVLLEPWMAVTASAPGDQQGELLAELSRRRGRVLGTDHREANVEIRAEAPLSELFGLTDALRAVTKGRASATMEPIREEPAPASLTASLLRQNQ